MILIANKVDLAQKRVVSSDAGREMARRLGVPYMETSAKDPPQNIDDVFRADILFLKHACSILRQSSNPACGFCMWFCCLAHGELAWLIHNLHSGLDDCLRMLQACFRKRMSAPGRQCDSYAAARARVS